MLLKRIKALGLMAVTSALLLPISGCVGAPKEKLYTTLEMSGKYAKDYKELDEFLFEGVPDNVTGITPNNVASITPNNVAGITEAHKTYLLDQCFPDRPKPAQAQPATLIPVVLFIIKPLIGLFFDEVEKSFERKIAKYSRRYSKTITIYPYSETAVPPGVNAELKLKSRCFRFARYIKITTKDKKTNKDETKEQTVLNFIGKWEVIQQQYIRIVPLSLYMGMPAVPKKSDEVSLAISVKAHSIWRGENKGYSKDIFNTVIAKVKFKAPTSDQKTKGWSRGFYDFKKKKKDDKGNESEEEKGTFLPVFPYTVHIGPSKARVDFAVEIAEVGDGKSKRTLNRIRKAIKLYKEDASSALFEAAKGLTEEDKPDDESDDKSDGES